MAMSGLIFEQPSKRHKEMLQTLNTEFQPYADTAYGTFLTWWDLYEDLSFGILNGNVVVQSSYATLGEKIGFTIVGANEALKTVSELFAYQKEHGLETVLYSMPEYYLAPLKKYEGITITHEPDIAEYILSADEQAVLEGNDFYMTRHKVHHFESEYEKQAIDCREIDLNDDALRDHLMVSLRAWGGSSKNDVEKLEEPIIDKSLRIHKEIELRCFAVFVKDILVGFALYKILPRGYVNINHLRVCHDYKNIFIYTLHTLSLDLARQGIAYINIEQDLGIEGLRTFKQRLRPIEMLNKYTIRLV